MAKQIRKIKKNIRRPKRGKSIPGTSAMSSQQALLQQAMVHHQAGRLSQAEVLYRKILRAEPDHPAALQYLGLLAHEVGKSDIAVELISKAINSRPDYAEAYYNLGIIQLMQGRAGEAAASLERALILKPDYVEAHNNLGNAFLTQGKVEEAIASYRRTIILKPDYAEAHYNLGNALHDLGKPGEAIASFQQALALKPDYVEAHYNLGIILQEEGRSDEAIASYSRALTLKPDYVEAHNNLGIILKDQGKLDEAVAHFHRALALKPDYIEARSNLLFCLNYLPGQTFSLYLEEARRYGRQATARVSRPFSSWSCEAKPERLRVGLLSDDFRNHPVGYFLESMLEHIDTARIELFAYPISNKRDELTARIRSRFVAWRALAGLDDAAAARLIRRDGVHVLLDLSGHTSNNRLPVFAWKPAPVQATWLGYFASTGIAEMDYIIADKVSIPESHRSHFTEEVWYLPETRISFSPPVLDRELPVAPLPALQNGFITFGCFQNLAKLNDELLTLWGKIFQLQPQARLRLQNSQFNSPAVQMELQERLARQGIAQERVTFAKAAPRREYLAAHSHIDIILDTFPFSGATTTCEALWMGVPTVTLAGNTMVARQGASLLSCAGLTDWVAEDPEEYVATAAAHAAQVDKLALLRSGLRLQVSASPLFDGPRFAGNLEAALWGMWRRFEDEH